MRNGVATLRDVDVAVAPSFTALYAVAKRLEDGPVTVAAQDCFWEDKGAFTGEVSPAQLADAGCKYVILGHSERRQLFGELDAAVNLKARAALRAGLSPIICVGETLAERDAGETIGRVQAQLDAALDRHRRRRRWSGSSIAYEPVWAIGTGRNATPAQAQEVHQLHSHPRRRARGGGRAAPAHPLRRQHEAGQRPRADGRAGRRRRPGRRRVAVSRIVRSSRAKKARRHDDTFLTILHVAVCLFLILVVLLQAGKGGGMGIAFGGGGSQTVFGSSGAGNFLTRLTSITAVIFMVTSLALAHHSSQQDSKRLQRLESKKAAEKKVEDERLAKLKAELEKAAASKAGQSPAPARRRRGARARRPMPPLPLNHPPLKLTPPGWRRPPRARKATEPAKGRPRRPRTTDARRPRRQAGEAAQEGARRPKAQPRRRARRTAPPAAPPPAQ